MDLSLAPFLSPIAFLEPPANVDELRRLAEAAVAHNNKRGLGRVPLCGLKNETISASNIFSVSSPITLLIIGLLCSEGKMTPTQLGYK